MTQPQSITYFDRAKKRDEVERIYGDGLIRWFYGSRSGKIANDGIASRHWFAHLYGSYKSSGLSRREIAPFIEKFGIRMDEFEDRDYRSFNDFFARSFRSGARAFVAGGADMPAFAEGRYLAFDAICGDETFPVKGMHLSAEELLGSAYEAEPFIGGPMLIARLSPVDYHRFHYPDAGRTIASYRVGGRLHSVNPLALRAKSDVFVTNERHVSILDTESFGRLAFVEVGALFVGRIVQTHSSDAPFERGDEKGYFLFGGSTVIVMGEKGRWRPDADLLEQTAKGRETLVRLGDRVGCARQRIPATFEALTPEWLSDALAKGGKVGTPKVRSVKYEPLRSGAGSLCLLARITLAYEGDAPGAPRSLIAKLPSPDGKTRAAVGIFNFYQREVGFYRDLAADQPVRTAGCFYGAFDHTNGDFVLLLEDLSLARLRDGDQVRGATAHEAELVVRAIAKQHIAWWNHPRLDTLAWLPLTDDPINKVGGALYPFAWPTFIERVGHELTDEMKEIGLRLGDRLGDILARFGAGPRTVLHGDLRLDNVFFDDVDGRPADLAFIDWQFTARGPGVCDVAYFLSQSVDVEVRRKHEMDLLRLYHRLLVEGGVESYSFAEMLEHYAWAVLYYFAVPVMGTGLADLSGERGLLLAQTMTKRSAAAILDANLGERLS